MTDDLDDTIRDQLRDTFPLHDSPSAVLGTLQPRLRRARARRRVAQIAPAIALTALVSVGVLTMVGGGDKPSELDVGVAPDVDLTLPSTTPLPDDGTTTSSEPSQVGATDSSQPRASTTTTGGSSATTSSSPSSPTTVRSTTTTATVEATSSTVSSTGAPTPTTEVDPDPGTIETVCGVVEVELVGSGIRLVRTRPNRGFEVELKSDEPDIVEVSFENDEQHCEVMAKNLDGEIWRNVVTED